MPLNNGLGDQKLTTYFINKALDLNRNSFLTFIIKIWMLTDRRMTRFILKLRWNLQVFFDRF